MFTTSYLQDFAHDLVCKHGCQTAAMVLGAFTNIGNKVPGEHHAEQLGFVASEMDQDHRLVETDGNFTVKPAA